MAKRKKNSISVSQHTLRAAFDILDRQLALADDKLRGKAIHEFHRQLGTRWNEHVDRLAQANGRTYADQLATMQEEIRSWTANTQLDS